MTGKVGTAVAIERSSNPLQAEPAHRVDHVMPLHANSSAGHNGHSRRSVDWFKNRLLFAPMGNIPSAEAEEAQHYAMLDDTPMAA